MLTVYLANKYIRVVEGTANAQGIHIKRAYYTVDNQGTILNGNIVDEDALFEMLKNLWETNNITKKDVHLVLDTMQFSVRLMQAPQLKPKKLMEYVSREFAGVERIANPVYGYFPIKPEAGKKSKDKTQRLYAQAAPREYVIQFVELFRRLGVELQGIESSSGAIIRLANIMKPLQGQSCILQFVDDMNLLSILMIDGNYETSNRKRLFSEPGTPGYAVEAARAMNNLVQFAKGQNIESPITHVYEAGMHQENFELYMDSIFNINPDLIVDKLSNAGGVRFDESKNPEKDFSHFALAMGGLIPTNPKTNVMTQLRYTQAQMEARAKRKKLVLPVAILGTVLVVTAAVLGVRVYIQNKQLKELEEYNNSETVLSACATYDELTRRMQAASSIQTSLQNLTDAVYRYPEVSRSVEAVLKNCAGTIVTTDVTGYDATTGQLHFDVKSGNVDQIHQFIRLLSMQEIFDTVDYTGYTENAAEKIWSVHVSCTMKAKDLPGQEMTEGQEQTQGQETTGEGQQEQTEGQQEQNTEGQ